MTKREQNFVLADQVMNWVLHTREEDYDVFLDEHGHYHLVNDPISDYCFMPTDNMHDAWKLIMKMGVVEVTITQLKDGRWVCSVNGQPEVEAESPPGAVCLAALRYRN